MTTLDPHPFDPSYTGPNDYWVRCLICGKAERHPVHQDPDAAPAAEPVVDAQEAA
jgi:hypothetical protein